MFTDVYLLAVGNLKWHFHYFRHVRNNHYFEKRGRGRGIVDELIMKINYRCLLKITNSPSALGLQHCLHINTS